LKIYITLKLINEDIEHKVLAY